MFKPIVFSTEYPYSQMHQMYTQAKRSEAEYEVNKIKYGKCDIEIPIKSIPEFLISEILNPFYVFQVSNNATETNVL